MVDSNTVLAGQTVAYTLYVLAIMAMMAWFAVRVTQQGGNQGVKPVLFYAFVGFLVVCGVSLHVITYNTIPWAPLDLNRARIRPDREFTITVEAEGKQRTLRVSDPVGSIANPSLREFVQLVRDQAALQRRKDKSD